MAEGDEAMTVAVTLLDGSEIEVECPNGRHTTAKEMRDLVASFVDMSEENFGLFGIWVMSSSLQLQAQEEHLPMKMLRHWDDLLERYTEAEPTSEDPVLCFKKDVYCHIGLEEGIEDAATNLMFFRELTYNVVYSLYPCDLEDAVAMAAVHLQMAVGANAKEEDVDEIEGSLQPKHLSHKCSNHAWKKKVLEARAKLNIPMDDTDALVQRYLKLGRNWALYGSTFFFGSVEPHNGKKSWIMREASETAVRIGVNFDGIHVIDDEKHTVLLSLPYDAFSYNTYQDPETQQSCFFVEFDSRDPEATSAETLLIWSKQAQLIDAVVTKYSEEAHKFTQLESKRRSSKGYEVKSTRRPRGRFSRSKNDAADAADAAEGGGFLSRMKTLRSSKRGSKMATFRRWSKRGSQEPAADDDLTSVSTVTTDIQLMSIDGRDSK